MTPHPDFAQIDVPRTHRLREFELDMLTAQDLDEDYAAVMSSVSVLQGMFGPIWPEGLTRADDEVDLHWHHREFTASRSFAWVIRTKSDGYVGCAYLFPDIVQTGSAEAAYWMIDTPDRIARLNSFGAAYVTWLASFLPDGYQLSINRND
ncbi:MAG: hypothetical protein AB3N09_13315 [Tateyamaria sp.]